MKAIFQKRMLFILICIVSVGFIFKYKMITLFFHSLSIFMAITFFYYLRNVGMEYIMDSSFSLKSKEKGERIKQFIDIGTTAILCLGIGKISVFVIKQVWNFILTETVEMAVGKLLSGIVLGCIIMIGARLHKNSVKNICQNIYIIFCIIFLVNLNFTMNQIPVKCNDIIYVDDFCGENMEWEPAYSDVFRTQSEGLFGTMNHLIFTGRVEGIKQKFQFEYRMYRVKNSWFQNLIKNRYEEDLERAECRRIDSLTIYKVEFDAEIEYEVGKTYNVSNEEKYDGFILIQGEEFILEFYYRNFEQISDEEIINVITNNLYEINEDNKHMR